MPSLTDVQYMSARLVYQSLNMRHITPIFYGYDAQVARYMLPDTPQTLMEARDLVLDTLESMRADEQLTVAIFQRFSGAFVGCAAISGIDADVPELGIWLCRSAWGHHYGREAIIALMAWYQRYFSPRYYAYPLDERNVASRHLAESCHGVLVRRYTTPGRGEIVQALEYHLPKVVSRKS